ncbi:MULTISPECIES: CapA family protein [Paenibacillus]|uniref:CapA family protein n=1 Tax=Paenibacillus TaxID=44249 RepID=UPI0022B91866|nr:CapA family protein [Paenibacillus caseinilyticus]MCZ8518068.1 CapA family protein [Paenibacillus caseinilyticus]
MWVQIAGLVAVTIGAFIYLIGWLEGPRPGGGGEPPAAAAEQPAAVPVQPVPSPAAEASPAAPAEPVPGTVPVSSTAGDGGGAAPPAGAGGQRVKLSFVGDVMFAGKVEDILKKNGYAYPFEQVKPYLEKADLTIANLETPITTSGTAQSKEYVYRSSPLALPELKGAGVDLVNVANNHSMDYGEKGLLDTLDHLDAQGIRRVGGGKNADEAYRYELVERQGVKIAFLGFSEVLPEASWFAGADKPGLAESYSVKRPLESIAKARQEADLVVVLAHWGEEREERMNEKQRDLARQYIDAGADLIVASHPHVVQGFELYKGKWIAYSLGNFIFTTNTNPNTLESMILDASCSKERSCDLSLVPIHTEWAQPVPMEADKGKKLFEKLTRISYNAKVDGEGKVTAGEVNPYKAPAKPASPLPLPLKTTEKKSGAVSSGTGPAAKSSSSSKATAEPAKSKTTTGAKTGESKTSGGTQSTKAESAKKPAASVKE